MKRAMSSLLISILFFSALVHANEGQPPERTDNDITLNVNTVSNSNSVGGNVSVSVGNATVAIPRLEGTVGDWEHWLTSRDVGDPLQEFRYAECRIYAISDIKHFAIGATDPDWNGKRLQQSVFFFIPNDTEEGASGENVPEPDLISFSDAFFTEDSVGKHSVVKDEETYDIFKKKCLPHAGELPKEVRDLLRMKYPDFKSG